MEYADYSPWKGELMVRHLSGCGSAEACGGLFLQGWFSLIMTISGAIEIDCDEGAGPLTVPAGRICGISNGARVLAVTAPLRCYVFSCSTALAIDSVIARYGNVYIGAVIARSVSAQPLSNAEIRHLTILMEMLQRKIEADSQPFQDEIVMLCTNLLLYEYSALHLKENKNQRAFHSRSEQIVTGFIALLDSNARSHHDVKFYAGVLCITDRHLRKAVRRTTGRSAKYFIEARLVSEALLLLNDENLTVSEISERLNFGTLSSFSAFFKKHAKLSPSQHRKRLRL